MSLPQTAYGIALGGYLVVLFYVDFFIIYPKIGFGTCFLDTLGITIISLWPATGGLLGIGLLARIRTPVRKTSL